jgi:hypothetical protein
MLGKIVFCPMRATEQHIMPPVYRVRQKRHWNTEVSGFTHIRNRRPVEMGVQRAEAQDPDGW